MKNFKFRCYTMKKDNLYFSANINLNLISTGKTIKESQNNLIELICDYFEISIIGKNYENIKHLLKRPAPLFMYFEYVLCLVIHSLALLHFKLAYNFVTFKRKFESTSQMTNFQACH